MVSFDFQCSINCIVLYTLFGENKWVFASLSWFQSLWMSKSIRLKPRPHHGRYSRESKDAAETEFRNRETHTAREREKREADREKIVRVRLLLRRFNNRTNRYQPHQLSIVFYGHFASHHRKSFVWAHQMCISHTQNRILQIHTHTHGTTQSYRHWEHGEANLMPWINKILIFTIS